MGTEQKAHVAHIGVFHGSPYESNRQGVRTRLSDDVESDFENMEHGRLSSDDDDAAMADTKHWPFGARPGIYNRGILLLDDACFGSAGVNIIRQSCKNSALISAPSRCDIRLQHRAFVRVTIAASSTLFVFLR